MMVSTMDADDRYRARQIRDRLMLDGHRQRMDVGVLTSAHSGIYSSLTCGSPARTARKLVIPARAISGRNVHIGSGERWDPQPQTN